MGQLRFLWWVGSCVALTASVWACGEPFSSSGSSGNGGSGGNASNAGNGGSGQTVTSGAGGETPEAHCYAGEFGQEPLLYSTLDDYDATVFPKMGPAGFANELLLEYEPTPFEFGVLLNSDGAIFSYPSANTLGEVAIDPRSATVDFCFKPDHDGDDEKHHNFFMVETMLEPGLPVHFFKADANRLVLMLRGQEAAVTETVDYVQGEWIHLTVAWNARPNAAFDAEIYIDGEPLNVTAGENVTELPPPAPSIWLRFGDPIAEGNNSPDGVLDEIRVYSERLIPVR